MCQSEAQCFVRARTRLASFCEARLASRVEHLTLGVVQDSSVASRYALGADGKLEDVSDFVLLVPAIDVTWETIA